MRSDDWFWEGNVQEVLAAHLSTEGWSVEAIADTATKARESTLRHRVMGRVPAAEEEQSPDAPPLDRPANQPTTALATAKKNTAASTSRLVTPLLRVTLIPNTGPAEFAQARRACATKPARTRMIPITSRLRHTSTVIEELRAAADALNRGDPEPFVSLFADDAEWRGVSRGHLWWKHTPS